MVRQAFLSEVSNPLTIWSLQASWTLFRSSRRQRRPESGLLLVLGEIAHAGICVTSLRSLPRPYINAEVSAGGFPGWAQNTGGLWRTSNTSYVEAYELYMTEISEWSRP